MRKWLFILWIFCQLPLFGQQELIVAEDSLVFAYNRILEAENDDDRRKAGDDFYRIFKHALREPGAFDYAFDRVITVSNLVSDDKKFRIFTWNLMNDAGENRFFGLIQLNPKFSRDRQNKVIELVNQQGLLTGKSENKSFPASQWPGAVYYELVTVKKGGKMYYTFAGWRGYDAGLTQKLLDVMYFQGETVKFGYPLFKINGRLRRRVVFSYNGKVSMLLMYDAKTRRFVFDHLAPENSMAADNPRFYGPDGSYDSFYLEKNIWIFEAKFDARNKSDDSDIFYNPVNRPDVPK